jgi:DNA (cytosine-5)-methyltransferase 1
MIVDLFAGAGGWDCAARQIGMPDPIGYENDPDACTTRRAADMPTVEADISTITPPGDIEGLIASPPCQSFSSAGKRTGLADDRGQLVWLPLEWAKATMPTWCAWEQVPEVLPIWNACKSHLIALGYSVWTGLLDAERYGVPQTRTRAILMAHRERPMTPPVPTHQKYQHDVPQGDAHACGLDNMFDAGVKPWVSMAEALGWGMTERPAMTLAPGTESGGADIAGGSGARKIINRERDEGRWVVHNGQNTGGVGNDYTRPVDDPAPTLGTNGTSRWTLRTGQNSRSAGGGTVEFTRPITDPAPTVGTMSAGQWVVDRPATTVTTDSRIATPGHHDENKRSFSDGAIRLTVEQAAALQTFPADHPWQGSNTAKHRQIGNAIPPMLAEAVLRAVIGA